MKINSSGSGDGNGDRFGRGFGYELISNIYPINEKGNGEADIIGFGFGCGSANGLSNEYGIGYGYGRGLDGYLGYEYIDDLEKSNNTLDFSILNLKENLKQMG